MQWKVIIIYFVTDELEININKAMNRSNSFLIAVKRAAGWVQSSLQESELAWKLLG
jgi:hypothetical protein